MPIRKSISVMDMRGNFVEIAPPPIVVNGTINVKPESVGKNPSYKSVNSSSVVLPSK